MDKLTIFPGKIRCLGNIISPKSLSSFGKVNSTLTSSTDTIKGQSMTVYNGSYQDGAYFEVDYDKWLSSDTEEFTISAVLKYNTGNVIYGATVTLVVNEDITLNEVTDSNGVVSFTVPCDDYYVYTCQISYDGNNNVAGCNQTVVVRLGDIEEIELHAETELVNLDETSNLYAIVSGSVNGETVGIPYQEVRFYSCDTVKPGDEFYLCDSFSHTQESNTETFFSLGIDDLGIDLNAEDFTLEWDYLATMKGSGLRIGAKSEWSISPVKGDYCVFIATTATGYRYYGQKTTTISSFGGGSVYINTTHHMKIVKVGNVFSFYIDNVLQPNTSTCDWWSNYHDFSIYGWQWTAGTTTISNVKLTIMEPQ